MLPIGSVLQCYIMPVFGSANSQTSHDTDFWEVNLLAQLPRHLTNANRISC